MTTTTDTEFEFTADELARPTPRTITDGQYLRCRAAVIGRLHDLTATEPGDATALDENWDLVVGAIADMRDAREATER